MSIVPIGQQEIFYDKLVFKLIQMLSKHMLETLNLTESSNYDIIKKIIKIHKTLTKLESNR